MFVTDPCSIFFFLVSSSKSAFEGKAKRRMSWHPSMISKRQSMGPYKPTPLDESVKKRLEQINAEFMQDEQEEEAALSSGKHILLF